MHPFRPIPKTPAFALPLWLQKTISAGATFLGVLLVVGAVSGGAAACGQPVFPTLSAIEQTIATDLAAGKSDAQIASDVCADLGGSSSTDAVCGGVETIVQDVITVLIDTGVISGKALENAKSYQLRHASSVTVTPPPNAPATSKP